MKKKLDDLTKMKLIYSGELLVFAVLLSEPTWNVERVKTPR